MPLVRHTAPRRRQQAAPALDAADPALRRQAALARAGEPEAAAALLDALAAEPVREVRSAIVTALIAIRTEEVAAGFALHLDSEDAGLRNEAIEGLRRLGAVAEGALLAALDAPDPDRRLLAINALDVAHAAWARPRLRRLLAEEPEVNVGLAAVEALALLGGPEDAAPLQGFAVRFAEEPMVGFAVRMAVDRLGGPAA